MYWPHRVRKVYEGSNPYATFLYHLAKIWGLAPFILKDNEVSRGSWGTKIYPLIFTGIGALVTELAFLNWINMGFTGDAKISKYTNVTAMQIRIFAVMLSTALFARERNNIVKIINRLVKADETLCSIGIQQDYETKFKVLALRIIWSSCIIIASEYIIIIVFWQGAKPFWYVHSIGQLFYITHHFVIFIFVSSMLVVNDRLKQLNMMLLNISQWKCKSIFVCERRGMFVNQVTPNAATMVEGKSTAADIPAADNMQLLQIFVKIEKVQSDLHDVVEKIVKLFSVPLFIIIGYYFLNILSDLYFIYVTSVKLFQKSDCEIISELVGVGLSVLIGALELSAIALACATIENTGKSTAIELHKMWVEYHPHFLKDEQRLDLRIDYPSVSRDADLRKITSTIYMEAMETQGESGPYVTFLYYFAKAFGLAPFSLENNRVSRGSFWDKLWPSIVLVIYAFFQTAVILQRLNVDDGIKSELTQTGDILAFQVELIVIVISVITVWYKKNDIVEIAQSFIMIKKMLKCLGIQQDYKEKLRRYAIFLGLSSCVVIFLEIQMDLVFMYVKNSTVTPLSITTTTGGSIIPCVYHFMIFNFVGIMMLTKECYAKLNYILSNVLYVQEINPNNFRGLRGFCASQIQPSNIALANEPMRFDFETLSDDELKPSQKLVKIQELHHELHDTIGKIVDLFSFPLLGVIGFYFTSITTNFFYLYAVLRRRVDYFGIVELLSSTVWMSLISVELCAIAVVCSSTQNTIQMLSLQLLQRPLTISAFGFFSLDYSYLYKIFCAVVAYFVIMVQLDTSKLEAAQNVSTLAPNVTGMH